MKFLFLSLIFAAVNAQAQTATTTVPATSTPAAPVKTEEQKKADEEARKKAIAQNGPSEDDKKVLDKIVVTGSYIRQSAASNSPSPVQTVTQERMQETGNYTVAGVLRETSAFNTASGATIALHGQSSADNLVLLNGLRLPKPAGGSAVNIDFLPATAMERVEVLKDGASALYGSEALAGVVNMITKKNYEGLSIGARTSYPEIGADQDTTMSITAGKNFGNKTNVMGIFQYRKKEALYWYDMRKNYGLRDIKQAGTPSGYPGNFIDTAGSGTYRDPNCPPNQIGLGGTCRYDYLTDRMYDAGAERDYYTGFLSVNHEFSKNLKLELTEIFVHQKSWNQGNAIPLTFRNEGAFGGPDYSIDPNAAAGWGGINTQSGAPFAPGAGNVVLQYSPIRELGPRTTETTTTNAVSQARLYGEVSTWDWELSGSYGKTYSKSDLVSGDANEAMLHTMLENGSFNPFAAGAGSNLNSAMLQTWTRDSADIMNTKLVFAGPLFNINSRPFSMAIGGEGQWMTFRRQNDPFSLQDLTISGVTTDQRGTRDVSSGFIEFSHSPSKYLEFQLAGRFDSYSDVGETYNPKIGMAFHPTEKFTMRASYGTGFKAPDMFSVYQGTRTNQSSVRDEVKCAVNTADPDCDDGIYPVTTFGNRNLNPERATHYNFGFVVLPAPKTIMAIDYWQVDGSDGLSAIDADYLTRLQQQGIPLPAGVTINRDPVTNTITSISHPTRLNGAIFKIRGIDFRIEKQWSINPFGLKPMTLRVDVDHSHVLNSGGNNLPGDQFQRQFDLNWKNVIGAAFISESRMTKFLARTYNGGDYDGGLTGVGAGSTYGFTEFDVHHEWFFIDNASVNFGIKDIFDTNVQGYQRGFELVGNSQSYFLGRTYYVGYTHDF